MKITSGNFYNFIHINHINDLTFYSNCDKIVKIHIIICNSINDISRLYLTVF